MSPRFEAFLARIYVDAEARRAFLADPLGVPRAAGLDEHEVRVLVGIDRVGLEFAAESFARKRARLRPRGLRALASHWVAAGIEAWGKHHQTRLVSRLRSPTKEVPARYK